MGLLQPIADVLKLLFKEIIIPSGANKFLFVFAPVLAIMPALAAWAVIPFDPGVVLADINAGLLYVLAMTSMGVYGVIIAGWASNSKYAFLGSLRSAAQIVAYEIAMGFALVGVLMMSGSLNLSAIVEAPARPLGLAVLEPHPAVPAVPGVLDLGRGGDQSRAVRRGRRRVGDRGRLPRRVLGHGLRHVLPRRVREHDPGRRRCARSCSWAAGCRRCRSCPDGFPWLLLKIAFVLFLFLWFRATFPRYRYDQIMRLGWKVFIPVTLVWLVVIGGWMQTPFWLWGH